MADDERIIGPVADSMKDPPRIDRSDTYIAVLISLWFSGVGIYLLPIGTGAVGTLDPGTQKLLGTAMVFGTSTSLLGVLMGPCPLWPVKPVTWLLKKIRKDRYHLLALRHCYRIGAAGLMSILSALFFFTLVLLSYGTLVGSFTGLLSPLLFLFWSHKALRLLREAKKMDKDYEEMHARLEEDGDDA